MKRTYVFYIYMSNSKIVNEVDILDFEQLLQYHNY